MPRRPSDTQHAADVLKEISHIAGYRVAPYTHKKTRLFQLFLQIPNCHIDKLKATILFCRFCPNKNITISKVILLLTRKAGDGEGRGRR